MSMRFSKPPVCAGGICFWGALGVPGGAGVWVKKNPQPADTLLRILWHAQYKETPMRIERELMRGAGPVAVLKLLQHGPQYGYQLAEALNTRTEGVLDMGQSTLYPMLYNLEAKGLIEGFVKDAPAAEGGRERKYYKLTPKGRKRLAKEVRQWQAVAGAMSGLGVLGPGASGAAPAGLAMGGGA